MLQEKRNHDALRDMVWQLLGVDPSFRSQLPQSKRSFFTNTCSRACSIRDRHLRPGNTIFSLGLNGMAIYTKKSRWKSTEVNSATLKIPLPSDSRSCLISILLETGPQLAKLKWSTNLSGAFVMTNTRFRLSLTSQKSKIKHPDNANKNVEDLSEGLE